MRAPANLVALLLLAACAAPPDGGADVGATVRGEVVSVDAAPLAYDGDALVVVRTDAGQRTVRIPARINLCETEDIAELGALQTGVRVEVRGEVGAGGDVTPCAAFGHYLRIVGQG